MAIRVGVLGAGAIGCFVGASLHHRLQSSSANAPAVALVGRPSLLKGAEQAEWSFSVTDVDYKEKMLNVPVELVDSVTSHDSTSEKKSELKQRVAPKTSSPSQKLRPLALSVHAEVLRECDVVLVCVKGGQTAEAAKQLADVLGNNLSKDMVVVSLQNGVRNADVLKEHLPKRCHVLAGMVEFNVNWSSTGAHFHKSTDGSLYVEKTGKLPPKAASHMESVVAALTDAEVNTHYWPTDQLRSTQYSKLLLNLINSVSALAGIPTKQMLSDRVYRSVFAAAVQEGLNVLRAAKIHVAPIKGVSPFMLPYILRLPNSIYTMVVRSLAKMDDKVKSSMLQDLERGRLTEVEHLNGEIVRIYEDTVEATQGTGKVLPGGRLPEVFVNRQLIQLIRDAEEKNRQKQEALKLQPEASLRVGSPCIPAEVLASKCAVSLPGHPLVLLLKILLLVWVLGIVWANRFSA